MWQNGQTGKIKGETVFKNTKNAKKYIQKMPMKIGSLAGKVGTVLLVTMQNRGEK